MPIEFTVLPIKQFDVDLAKLRLRGGIKTLAGVGPHFSVDMIEAKISSIRNRLSDDLRDLFGGENDQELENRSQRRIGKLIALADIRRPAQVPRVLRAFRLALERLEAGNFASQRRDVMLVRDPSEQTTHARGFELTAPVELRDEVLAKAFGNREDFGGRIDALLGAAKTMLAEHARNPDQLKADEACILLTRAAAQGSREAQGRLENLATQSNTKAIEGLVFVHAHRLPVDMHRAVRYAEEGAALGAPSAHLWLGRYYSTGRDCTPDLARALDHYEAVEAVFTSASSSNDVSHRMSELYGMPGPAQNIERSDQLLMTAAERGNVKAALDVGAKLFDRPQSSTSTAGWARTLQEAAEEDLTAAFMFGVAHSKGCFTDADDAAAVRYLHRVAEAGHGPAAFLVAQHYEEGRGVTKNAKNALRSYRFAAKHNDLNAIRVLSRRYMFGDGVNQNIQRGLEYLKQAADLGDSQAATLYAEAQERQPS